MLRRIQFDDPAGVKHLNVRFIFARIKSSKKLKGRQHFTTDAPVNLIGLEAYLNLIHHPKRGQNQKALSEDSG